MNENNQKYLNEKYKDLYKNDSFYYQCGDGWVDLLDDLFYAIESYLKDSKVNLELFWFTQIKEKFSTLRAYYGFSEELMDIDNIDTITDKIEEIIGTYEEISGSICENCSRYGKTRTGSWLRVLCNGCFKKREGANE
jgi:hypothetical protein